MTNEQANLIVANDTPVENADAEGEEGLDLWASLTQDMTPEEKKTYERLCSEKPEMVQKWLDTDTSMFKGMDLGLPEDGDKGKVDKSTNATAESKTPEGKAVPTSSKTPEKKG